jgi:hypothetical protein
VPSMKEFIRAKVVSYFASHVETEAEPEERTQLMQLFSSMIIEYLTPR